MPAEGEEVVAEPHLAQPQEVGPDAGDQLLHQGPRPHGARPLLLDVLFGQLGERPPVHLAAGRERQRVEQHDPRRDHGLRQAVAQGLAQLRGRQARSGGRHREGHQPDAGAFAAGDHDRLPHPGARFERRLDLSQLDADAAHLELVIEPAEIFDRPVRQPAGEVAGAVEPAAGRKPRDVGDEALGGEVGPLPVAARHLDAADAQLAGNANRRLAPARIEDVDAGVGHRPADRNHREGTGGLARQGPGRDLDCRLGRAVEVVQPGSRGRAQALLEAARELGGERLATREHLPQPGTGLDPGLLQEGLQQRGHEVHRRHPPADDRALQVGGIAVAARRGEREPRAEHQRPEELPDRDVEAHRGLLEHRVAGGERERLLPPEQPVDDPAVRVHHALGPAGGARGIDDVGETVRVDLGERPRGLGEPLLQEHDRHGGVREGWDGRPRPLLRQEHPDLRVLQHEGEALGRIRWVERHVGGAGPHHAEQPDHQLRRALGEHADPLLGTDPHLPQMAGQGARAVEQLAVGQVRAILVVRHGHSFGSALGPRLDPGVHGPVEGTVGGENRVRVVPRRELPALGLGQHRQLPGPALRRLRHPRQEIAEMAEHPLRGRGVEQVGVELQREAEPPLPLGGRQHQVELRPRVRQRQRLQRQAPEREPRPLFVEGEGGQRLQRGLGGLLKGKHGLEEMRAARVALRPQALGEQRQGEVLVREGVERRAPRARHARRPWDSPERSARSATGLTK